MSAFLACDWGTTNLRAWVLDEQGRPLRDMGFADLGVSRLKPGEAAERFVTQVRPAMQAEDLPAILCGMIGSTLGWAVAPYEQAPVGLEDLAAKLTRVQTSPPVWIIPGVQGPGVAGAPDVMRGEETQVLGWVAQDPARARDRWIICHPGTHAKWIVLEEGKIRRFATAMTGELFDVLRKHSVLKSDTAGPIDPDAFALGVDSAGDGAGLSTRLFTVRTRVVADGLDPRLAGSYLSGLLIGSEIASTPQLLGLDDTAQIAVLGVPALCELYAMALERRGRRVSRHDGDAAALAGLTDLYRRLMKGAAA